MTTPDPNDYIGRTGLYATGPEPKKRTLRVRVRVVRVKSGVEAFGNINLTVTPADGEGELTIRHTSLKLDDEPEPAETEQGA